MSMFPFPGPSDPEGDRSTQPALPVIPAVHIREAETRDLRDFGLDAPDDADDTLWSEPPALGRWRLVSHRGRLLLFDSATSDTFHLYERLADTFEWRFVTFPVTPPTPLPRSEKES